MLDVFDLDALWLVLIFYFFPICILILVSCVTCFFSNIFLFVIKVVIFWNSIK